MVVSGSEFVLEPESFVDSEDDKAQAEFEAKMKDIETHRDKLRARLREIIKHRRERSILKEKFKSFK